jgi:hypothetical protein
MSGTDRGTSRLNFVATPDTEIYLKGTREFLLALLDASVKGRGEIEAVYPLLEENVELLEPHFIYELRSWGRETFPQLPQEKKVTIANALADLSRVIWALPEGDPDIDLEIAIACNELALELLNSSESPELWATINNNLALAYSERSVGDTVNNDLKSYANYHQAQQIFPYEPFPQQWAKC